MKQNVSELSAVRLLQSILKGLLGAAQMHYIHAKLNEQRGFSKLSARMLEEYEEEMASVAKVMEHIARLGGEIKHEVQAFEIYTDIEDQIRQEAKIQAIGVEGLEELIKAADLDLATENYLNEYFDGEVEHNAWLQQQVALIDTIGIQNYLTTQL